MNRGAVPPILGTEIASHGRNPGGVSLFQKIYDSLFVEEIMN
jgi:hypothetical protein